MQPDFSCISIEGPTVSFCVWCREWPNLALCLKQQNRMEYLWFQALCIQGHWQSQIHRSAMELFLIGLSKTYGWGFLRWVVGQASWFPPLHLQESSIGPPTRSALICSCWLPMLASVDSPLSFDELISLGTTRRGKSQNFKRLLRRAGFKSYFTHKTSAGGWLWQTTIQTSHVPQES